MEVRKLYTKFRKDFGRQPMFCEVPVHLLDSINPDVDEQQRYCLRNPVNHETQTSTSMSENDVNTKRVIMTGKGVNHAEGGWPKDIHFADEELTSRYRRRFERDDSYVSTVLDLYPELNHYINQNNAIEMYEMYFKDMNPIDAVEKISLNLKCVFKDTDKRPIACINWTYEDKSKLAVAYCDKKYPVNIPTDKNVMCHIWDLKNPNYPSGEFLPPTGCWQLACSPVHSALIVGGLEDGTVCIFDLRVQKEPVITSPMYLAHREPVSALVYMQSRLNTDFFSGSSDGTCKWWDVRNISYPTDFLIMSLKIPSSDPTNLTCAEGISSLQYDRALPTRFLCGTETGNVVNVNRKGKNHREIMSAIYYAQNGPVKTVQRSPCTSKMFITCGDWTVHIWSEDIQSAPIISGTPHRYQISDVVWCPRRYSSYMSVSSDGKLRFWDLLRKYREPVTVLSISEQPLLKVKPNKEGELVAIGDAKGAIFLLSLSEDLVYSGERDKQLMTQLYERETRRESILETRVKEIRVKLKVEEKPTDTVVEVIDDEAVLKKADDEYRRIVSEEINQAGFTTIGNRVDVMRKR